MGEVCDVRWRAMGTECHAMVHLHDAADTGGPGPLTLVTALVADLEARWSRFLPASELSQINARAGEDVTVSELTVFAVLEALEARRVTDGRFDPTVLPALERLGYDRDFAEVAAGRAGRPPTTDPPPSAGAAVRVDPALGTVRVAAGSGLDLGGIGKGLAADLVATAVLGDPAVQGTCVNLGGDLRCTGIPPTSAGWGIAIDDPGRPGTTLATVAFAAGGLATSSTRRRRWTSDGGTRHHVVDPASGSPADDAIWSATVLAASAARAEALATAAVVAGSRDAEELLLEAGTPALNVEEHRRRMIGSIEEYLR